MPCLRNRTLSAILSLVMLAGLIEVLSRPTNAPGDLRLTSGPGAIGEKSVDAFGAYRRDVPLRTPSFFGIQPSLRLVYSSLGGNGLAGTGWALAGFPEIKRTSPGFGAPAFDATDVFHLDGAELVPCTPAMTDPSCLFPAGAGHVQFAARSADYRRIALDKSNPRRAPRWLVWSRDGNFQVFDEEPHPGTSEASAWALTSTTDPEGHQVGYVRKPGAGSDTASYPSTVTYGGVTVSFYYQNRLDTVVTGDGRALVRQERRLRTVDVTLNGARIRLYRLSYDLNATTGRSLLSRLEEFGDNARIGTDGEVINPMVAVPLPAMTFAAPPVPKQEWTAVQTTGLSGLPSVGGPRTPILNGMAFTVAAPFLLNAPPNLGDVDGNGRTDWVQATPDLTYNSSGTPIHTQILITAALPGRSAPIYTQTTLAFPFAGIMRSTYLADADADGRADLIFLLLGGLIAGTDPNLNFRSLSLVVARSVGDGSFAWLSSGVATTPYMTRDHATYRKTRCAPGDVDGDRRADLLCSWTDDSDNHHLGTARGKGDGTWSFGDEQMSFDSGDGTRDMTVGDTNGDRLTDAMFLDYPACAPAPDPCTSEYILTTAVSDGSGGYRMERQASGWQWGVPTFFSADINGDRRSDYVLFASVDENSTDPGAIQTALSKPDGGYTIQSQPVPVVLRQIQHTAAVGDFDGDAMADLMVVSRQPGALSGCSSALRGTHLNLHRLRSLGDGTFDLPPTWEDCSKSKELDVPWDDVRFTPVESEAADLDGDGADDFLIAESPKGTDVTTLHEDLSANPDKDAHAWRPGEFNGDGRTDWVYFLNTVTGPLITTLLSNASGGFTVRGSSPQPFTQRLTAQASWRVTDINADGLDDVVHLRYADPGTGIEVSSWIAKGNGDFDFKQETTHVGLTVRHRDIVAWRTGDLNSDGRGDLLYVDRDDATGGLKIWTSLSNGDGTWKTGNTMPAGPPNTWPGPDGAAWRTADLNGDGRHDLIHLALSAGSVQLRSLMSNGDGQFSPKPVVTLTGPDFTGLPVEDLAGWSVADANADGYADLAHLSQSANTVGQPAGVKVLTLLGHGNGGFTSRRDEPRGTFTGDLSQWRSATVSPDGRTDLVHVRNDGNDLFVTTLMPAVDGWRLSAQQTVKAPIGTTAGGFTVVDADGNGESDLVRFDLVAAGGMRALTVKADLARDVIAKVGLSTGGTEEVEYAVPHPTGGGTACALPSGVSELAVSVLRQNAGPGMGQGQASFDYSCPHWSQRRRAILGWEYVTTAEGASTHHPSTLNIKRYDLTDACGARLALDAAHDPQGAFLRKEITAYKHTGSAAPFTCLVDNVNRITAGLNDSLNATTGFLYDAFGNVTSVLENGGGATGRTTNISYVSRIPMWIVNRPWQYTVYDGSSGNRLIRSIYHCYDGANGTDQVNCPNSVSLGRLTAIKLVNANGWYDTTSYAYDPQGNIGTVTDADGRVTTIGYDPMFQRFPASVCDSLAHCTQIEWNYGTEQVAAAVDANTARTTYGYDEYGRLTSVSSPAGTRTFQRLNAGDPALQRLRTTQSDGTADGLWTESSLDGLGRIWQQKAEGPTATDTRIQSIGYDDASPYAARRSHWYFAGAAPIYENFLYDAAGRQTFLTHPDGTGLSWLYSGDANTATTRISDESGQATLRAFDGYDRTKTAQADPGGFASGTTNFATNAMDELTTITDPLGNSVAEQIDPRGDLVSLTDPDRGNSTTDYDRTGHVKQHFPQSGGIVTNWYDPVGRRKTTQLASYRTINWLYDEPGHGSSAGRLTAITDTNGLGCPFRNGVAGGWVVDERSYDLAGRMSSRTLCVEGESKTFGFAYDAMSRQDSITYPDGEKVEYHYNDAGQLKRIDGYVTDIQYDAAERMTSIVYDNGTSETFSYDPRREWLDLHRVLKGATVLSATEYHYYSNGQLNWQSTTGTGSGASAYTYDGAGRLTDVTGTGPGHYEYDVAGDLTFGPGGPYFYTHTNPAQNRCGGTGGNTCPHAVKKVGTGSELTYNLRGEVTQIRRTNAGTTTVHDIGWNLDGEPVTFSTNGSAVSSVTYGVDGERTSVTNGPQTTRSFGGYLEVTRPMPGAPAVETKSYYAGSVLLAQRGPGSLSFNHRDTLGSTSLVTDSTGAVQANYTYDAYGRSVSSSGAGGDRRFAGHKPVEFGLIDMGARLYDPQLARFLSPDPKLPDPRQPRPVDPFSYANGDPVNLIDPTGNQATRNWAFGAHGTGGRPTSQPGVQPSGQPSGQLNEAELNELNTWIGRQDPAAALPTPLQDTGLSNMGGACNMCHGKYVARRELTTGEKIAFGVIIGVAVIAAVVLIGAEILAIGAVEVAVTAVDAIILRASAWLVVRVGALAGSLLALIRGGQSGNGSAFVHQAEDEVSRMRLDFEIWEGDTLVETGSVFSGPGGNMGHAEVRWVEEYMGYLGPQHDVVLLGQHNMCGHGECRYFLNSMSIMDGPNIWYFGHSFQSQPMLQQFISGVGIVYSSQP